MSEADRDATDDTVEDPLDDVQNGTIGRATLADIFSVLLLGAVVVVGGIWALLTAYLIFAGRIAIDYTVTGVFDIGLLDDFIYALLGLAFIEIYGRDKFKALLENWPSKRRDDE